MAAAAGMPSEVINRVTTEQQADLVIVGRRGRNPLAELLVPAARHP